MIGRVARRIAVLFLEFQCSRTFSVSVRVWRLSVWSIIIRSRGQFSDPADMCRDRVIDLPASVQSPRVSVSNSCRSSAQPRNSPLQVPVAIRRLTLLSAFTLRYDEIKASLQVKRPAVEAPRAAACRPGGAPGTASDCDTLPTRPQGGRVRLHPVCMAVGMRRRQLVLPLRSR